MPAVPFRSPVSILFILLYRTVVARRVVEREMGFVRKLRASVSGGPERMRGRASSVRHPIHETMQAWNQETMEPWTGQEIRKP